MERRAASPGVPPFPLAVRPEGHCRQRRMQGLPAMKLAILSRNSKLYSTRRLVEAARERGHSVRVLDPLRCYLRISSDGFDMRYKGKPLAGYDAVIPRIGASVTRYGTRGAAPVRADGQLHARTRPTRSRARATSCAATSCWRRRASACR